jgi:hypothetical protein
MAELAPFYYEQNTRRVTVDALLGYNSGFGGFG